MQESRRKRGVKYRFGICHIGIKANLGYRHLFVKRRRRRKFRGRIRAEHNADRTEIPGGHLDGWISMLSFVQNEFPLFRLRIFLDHAVAMFKQVFQVSGEEESTRQASQLTIRS